jgi:uncharacterized coiled-coil DUF342 family protein
VLDQVGSQRRHERLVTGRIADAEIVDRLDTLPSGYDLVVTTADRERAAAKRDRDRLQAQVAEAEGRVAELEDAARRDQAALAALRRQLKEASLSAAEPIPSPGPSPTQPAAPGAWARDRAALEEAAREAREAADELRGKASRLEKELAAARAERAEAVDALDAVRGFVVF